MPINRLKRPQSLSEAVLHDLRKAIIEGSLELGAQVSELSLSELLGVSKTPVREALQELRRLGLVQITPKSGTSIFLPDEKELTDIFDLRMLLELGAADRLFENAYETTLTAMRAIVNEMETALKDEHYYAYRQLDSRFHQAIVAGAGNLMLIEAYAPLSLKIDALRNRGLVDINVASRSLAFHKSLLEQLSKKQKAVFSEALSVHISNSKRDYLSWLERFNQTLKGRRDQQTPIRLEVTETK